MISTPFQSWMMYHIGATLNSYRGATPTWVNCRINANILPILSQNIYLWQWKFSGVSLTHFSGIYPK